MLKTGHADASAGFSLIELLFAMAIAAILATIALPTFERQLHRVLRTDALIAAMQVQQAEERFRGGGASYGGLAQIGAPATSAQGHYRLEIVRADADGYELVATAIGLQARDAVCRFMKLSSSGLNVRQASGPDDRLGNAETQNRQCWGLR